MKKVVKYPSFKIDRDYLFLLRKKEKVSGKLLDSNGDILIVDTDLGVREIVKNNIYFFKEIKN